MALHRFFNQLVYELYAGKGDKLLFDPQKPVKRFINLDKKRDRLVQLT